jgi:hypothetical protein
MVTVVEISPQLTPTILSLMADFYKLRVRGSGEMRACDLLADEPAENTEMVTILNVGRGKHTVPVLNLIKQAKHDQDLLIAIFGDDISEQSKRDALKVETRAQFFNMVDPFFEPCPHQMVLQIRFGFGKLTERVLSIVACGVCNREILEHLATNRETVIVEVADADLPDLQEKQIILALNDDTRHDLADWLATMPIIDAINKAQRDKAQAQSDQATRN